MRGFYFLFLPLTLVVDCRTFRDLRYDYLSDITTVSSQRIQVKRLTLFPLEMKNPGIAALAGSNLSDNLALHLRRLGYFVAEAEKPQRVVADPVPVAPQEVTPEPEDVEEGEEKPQPPKPEVVKPEPPPSSQEEISKILGKNKTPVYITGYVYETRTGSLLDEEISTGVLLRIHDERGELLAQIRYIGESTLDSYESNAGVARALAARFHTLAQ